jgi:uncharacterized protein
VIAIDTNILVYAHREDAPWHDAAVSAVTGLAEGTTPWALPWPCLHEFLAIVTHPRIFKTPSPLQVALRQVDAWLDSPTVVLLAESEGHWPELRGLLSEGRVAGPLVHDARVAGLCLEHGVKELWSADRDFGRFPRLVLRNPLVG